jgi:ubiquinone/menaquinone biosynthesis C-methylase UbiE
LRAERFARVLERIEGRCIDVGAGDNALIRLYRARAPGEASAASVGVDVVDWGGDTLVVPDSARLPFAEASFDTACFVACLNHIPARGAALAEAFRVLRPGGRLIVTMIGRRLGALGHAVWWYSEDKHRAVAAGETGGLDPAEVLALIAAAGFVQTERHRFVYGLNGLFLARRPRAA